MRNNVGPWLSVMFVPALALGCTPDHREENATTMLSGAGQTETTEDADDEETTATPPVATGSGSADGTTVGTEEGSESSGRPPVFDLNMQPDIPLDCNKDGGGGGDPDQSYIWISNSNEGTISKINTVTMVEEGRYLTRPGTNGNPSRTSVNFNGDVAVANREGGVTKIFARPQDCPDPTNTSTGPDDVKPWPDGCIDWYIPFPYSSQRPIAWTQGTYNKDTCRYDETKVWTSGYNTSVDVLLIDGDSGTVDSTIAIGGIDPGEFGFYGGAVDGESNFWASQIGNGHLLRVNRETLAWDTWLTPTYAYGITVDHLGQVWTCHNNAARFDPMTETWDIAMDVGGNGGCMEDGEGTLWIANNPIVGVDIMTMEVVQTIDLPHYVHGISIDFEGNVWAPAIFDNRAYRVNPTNGSFNSVTGLNNPYTYSDMTGFALSIAGGIPG